MQKISLSELLGLIRRGSSALESYCVMGYDLTSGVTVTKRRIEGVRGYLSEISDRFDELSAKADGIDRSDYPKSLLNCEVVCSEGQDLTVSDMDRLSLIFSDLRLALGYSLLGFDSIVAKVGGMAGEGEVCYEGEVCDD